MKTSRVKALYLFLPQALLRFDRKRRLDSINLITFLRKCLFFLNLDSLSTCHYFCECVQRDHFYQIIHAAQFNLFEGCVQIIISKLHQNQQFNVLFNTWLLLNIVLSFQYLKIQTRL